VVVLRSVRAGAPQSAGQRAAALQARRVMLPCGAPRVTSQLVRADRIRTNVYRGTNVYGGAYPYYGWGAVAAGVATGAALGAAAATPYYYPYYPYYPQPYYPSHCGPPYSPPYPADCPNPY